MKVVHAADLHLDSPLAGLERYEGAPAERLREATRRAFENLVELCLTEDARLLLLAGDLYDGTWKDYSTGLFFTSQMVRLREAGVRVVSVRGNHDAASQITAHLRLPDNVRDLDTARPESVVFEDLGIAVHGQGFATRAVTADLVEEYPAPIAGALNVGLLHTSLDGRPGHATYAPTTLRRLEQKGYAYWALGHVHTREVIARDPWVVFPGNLQGRHARETGPKGATLLDVADGAVRAVTHRPLDVVRFLSVDVDGSDAADRADAVERCRAALESAVERSDGRLVVARVALHGQTSAHEGLAGDPDRLTAEVRALAADVGADALWVERVSVGTRSAVDLESLRRRDDAVGHLARAVEALRAEDVGALLSDDLTELRSRLPIEVRERLGLEAGALFAELLQAAEPTLFSRLTVPEGDEA
jgi:DNA repair protein SbcD/Mre11